MERPVCPYPKLPYYSGGDPALRTELRLQVNVTRSAITWLLAAGLSVVSGAELDATAGLLRAVYSGDVQQVRQLIAAGADVRAPNQFGATPMSVAAVAADPEMLKVLLKAGADADSTNAEGETALMVVARTGNVESAKLLLKAGANLQAHEQWGGQTALMWAAAQSQPEMIRFLLSRGAHVDERSTSARLAASRHRGGQAQGHVSRWPHAAAVQCSRRLHRVRARAP